MVYESGINESEEVLRVAHIVPPALLKPLDSALGSYHLILTELVLNNELYRNFYVERVGQGDTVILDTMTAEVANGLAEATLLADLIRAAELVHPTVTVLPDRIGATFEETIRLVEEALNSGLWGIPGQFMAVPHGETYEKYLRCARELAVYSRVRWLGLYKEIEHELNVPRVQAVRDLSALPVYLHLLGMTRGLEDMQDPEVCRRCMGADGSKLVRWGYDGVTATAEHVPEYPGRGADYFKRGIPGTIPMSAIRANISYWNFAVGTSRGVS